MDPILGVAVLGLLTAYFFKSQSAGQSSATSVERQQLIDLANGPASQMSAASKTFFASQIRRMSDPEVKVLHTFIIRYNAELNNVTNPQVADILMKQVDAVYAKYGLNALFKG